MEGFVRIERIMNMKITEVLKEKKNFCSLGQTTEAEILDAEYKLGTKFAKEYAEIIREFGVFSCLGHEFTGICNSKRLNIVDVTLAERELNPNASELYVIETATIDSIVIWQSSDGTVYYTKGVSKPKKISESLIEYLGNN